MGQTLQNVSAEALLYTVVAMRLVVSCLPRGTCCRHCPVFVSTAAAVFPGAEADAVVAAAAEALALRAHALVGEGPLLLTVVLLGLLFPAQFIAT
jgi:hypothetical protein